MKKPFDIISGLWCLTRPDNFVFGTARLIIIAALSGCSSAPVVVPEIIRMPTFIPYPATLVQPVKVDLTGATWGSAVGSLHAGLETCNAQLQSISTLKPPSPP